MPVQVSYPGVYIQEVSSGVRTITGVSTSVALFVGKAAQGPMTTPIRTLSYSDFERAFGTTNQFGEFHAQVKNFFLNGGSQAWVMRVASGSAGAAATLQDISGANDCLTLTARSHGTLSDNLRAEVDYDTPTPESTFNLRVYLTGTDKFGNPIDVVTETFNNLSMNPSDGNYAVTVLDSSSELVTAVDGGAPAVHAGYTLLGTLEPAANNAVLSALIDGITGKVGRFQVSVNGGPFAIASVAFASATEAGLQAAINLALAAQGVTVTVTRPQIGATSGYYGYVVTVDGVGGRVRFAAVPGDDDIAVAMGMTAAEGALEVDGYASRRPAPMGKFSNLSLSSVADFDDLLAKTLTTVTVTDGSVGSPTSVNPTFPGTTFAHDGSVPRLKTFQASLDAIVTMLNADSTIEHTAKRVGHRLWMTANYGGDAGDTTTAVTGTGGTGATQFDNLLSNTPNVTRYVFAASPVSSYQGAGADGSNGVTATKTEYEAAFEIAARDIDLFNILILPRADDQSDGDRQLLWAVGSVFAKSQRAIIIVDPPDVWTTADEAAQGAPAARIGVATDHAAIYWPRIKVDNKVVDPAGAMAGVMARIDGSRGVWKAPAGTEANMYGVRGVQHGMSNAENGLINPQAVNAIRTFPAGVVSWGARTMVGYDNSGNDDYKYLPVRRLALFIEESLYRGLQWAVFEPNDEPLWAQLRQAAGSFMRAQFRAGAFAGTKASDAYFVKVDRETTTQTDINLGIVNVVIGFAPLKPAEFVVITLQQQTAQGPG